MTDPSSSLQSELQHSAVLYTPSGGTRSQDNHFQPLIKAKSTPSQIIHTLQTRGVKFVRIQWVDLINQIRLRIVPIAYFEKLLNTSRPGTSIAKVALGLVFITVAQGFSPTGEYLYAIDLSTFRVCPFAPGHASVLGFFEEKIPHPGLDARLAIEVDLCPRTILRRVVENAKRLSGTGFLIGFETEFILLKSTYPVEANNHHGWCNSSAFPSSSSTSSSPESAILEQIADSLQASGIELQMYHSEAAPGQYEVITGPLGPLEAVDALIHTRETIFNVASQYGLRATLAPRVFLDNCGSAAHAHISVHSEHPRHTRSNDGEMSPLEQSFVSGILDHLSSIALLLLPTTASYQRMMDGVWSGGTWVCWGVDNREAPLRVCNAHSPSSRNFELKVMDGTANPYLAMAAVLGAGMEGILEERALDIQACGDEGSAALIGAEGRKKLGIKERMPLTWEEATSKFGVSGLVDAVFGRDFKEKYLNVNKTLKHQLSFGLMDDEELKKLVEHY